MQQSREVMWVILSSLFFKLRSLKEWHERPWTFVWSAKGKQQKLRLDSYSVSVS